MAEQAPWEVDWSASAPQAAAAQNPWDVDWSAPAAAKPAPSLAHEAAAVGITGPVKGAISATIGLPGDVEAGLKWLVGKGVLSLGDLVGLPRPAENAPQPLADQYAPTSANIVKGIEKVTGKLPEAESTPGKIGEAVTEFAPGALTMGPEQGIKGAVSNFTKLAALPGAASEGLGEEFQGTWAEPIVRTLGALGGGVAGGLGGKVTEALANRGAAGRAATDLGGEVNPAAVRKVAANYEADQLNPQIIAQRQADLGPEAMMLDMGRQMQGRAEGIASQPGKGQNQILDAVQERVHGRDQFGQVNEAFGEGTANRIKDTLDQTMGPSPDIVAYQNHINQTVDRMAKPLYDNVMNAHDVVNVPDSITSRPAVADAMKRAVSLAKNYGEKLEGPAETKTILSGPGYHIAEDVTPQAQTSLRYWDYVKKAMDQRIRGIMQSGDDLSSAEKADLGGLQSARRALVDHLDDVTGGAYALARKVAATKPEVKEAVELGRSSLNNGLLPEELAAEMQGMSVPQQAAAKAGMRREVERIVDTARNDGAAARRILDTNQNREKIAQVFGKDAADAIDQRIAAETKFQNAADKIGSNSRTAVRTQLAKDTEAPSISQPPTANIAGLALSGIRRGREYLGDVALDRTRQGIADLLTRRGADIPTLAQVLGGYNAARATNAGPTIGRQASSLAALLAGQAPGWISGFLPGNGRPNQGTP